MSFSPVSNSTPSRSQAALEAQRLQTERTSAKPDTTPEPNAEPTASKNPVEAAVQEAVRQVQQGIEALLKKAVPPAPGDAGGEGDSEIGPQAGRKIRCGRGGRCVAEATPRLGLQNNVG